jgi:hypothetical protein
VTWNENASSAEYGLELIGDLKSDAAAVTNATSNLSRAAQSPSKTNSGARLIDLPSKTIETYTFSK